MSTDGGITWTQFGTQPGGSGADGPFTPAGTLYYVQGYDSLGNPSSPPSNNVAY